MPGIGPRCSLTPKPTPPSSSWWTTADGGEDFREAAKPEQQRMAANLTAPSPKPREPYGKKGQLR